MLNIAKYHVMYISVNIRNKLPSYELIIMLNGQALSILQQLTMVSTVTRA